MLPFNFLSLLVHAVLTGLLLVAARQDLRARLVSNWLSLPLFLGGGLALLIRGDGLFTLLFILFVALAILPGGYGAADGKITAGLAGLWPGVLLPSVLLMPLFDYWWRKNRTSPAPLTVSIAAAALLTILAEGGRILLDKRLNP
jgi:hypothetical protein